MAWPEDGSPTPARVLVVGDVMLDQYVIGVSDRMSPEAPVPVIRVESTADHLGGAANVARQVVALGGVVDLVGVVGDDEAGRRAVELCGGIGVGCVGVVVDPDRVTTTKQRIVSGRQQVARLDREDTGPIGGATLTLLVDALGRVQRPDVIVVSDYAKGVVGADLFVAVVEAATRWGVPVLVDPKHPDLSRYRGAAVVKANLVEFERAVGERSGADPVGYVAHHGHAVRSAAGLDHLIVTLGAGGLVVLSAEGATVPVAASPRDVYDVSGAGDTVMAALALGLASGRPVLDAAVVANAAAGLSVQRPGVAVVLRSELVAELLGRRGHKICTADELLGIVARWRRDGRRIVFTNGCFDLFHSGHVHLLTSAARLGDVLVVAVDSDRSVAALKGPDRPVVDESGRLAVIGALECVDAVVAFETGDLERLIELVGPDVLVKGSDYRDRPIVGAELVEAAGGSVQLVELVPDRSTTDVVAKIRRA